MSKFDELITTYDYLFTKQYRIDESGVTHGQYDREKDTFKSDATVSQKPILPVAILDNLDNEVQKVEVAWWEAEKGKWVRTVTNRETLVNTSKITKLADRGVPVGSQNSKSMSNYFNTLLCEYDGKLPRKPARSVMGWCELDDRLLFMPYTDLVDFDGGDEYKAEPGKHGGSVDDGSVIRFAADSSNPGEPVRVPFIRWVRFRKDGLYASCHVDMGRSGPRETDTFHEHHDKRDDGTSDLP